MAQDKPINSDHVQSDQDHIEAEASERHHRAVEDTTIPVVEEELAVGKREVERGSVRVQTSTTEIPVEEDVKLREENVTVERRTVDRPASKADFETFEEGTVELTETAEEVVVGKEARVVEEITVRKDVEVHTETVQDTVRRTVVEVEEVGAQRFADARDFATYDTDFRQHHTSTFASGGIAYEEYEPAYRYGYELGSDERYRSRDWTDIEAGVRRDWERQHAGTWDQYQEAIRYAWNRNRIQA